MISPKATIGKKTLIYNKDLVVIGNSKIGDNSKIHPFVTIQDGASIGNSCKLQAYAFIPTGVTIEDEVFIGQSVCFTNDKYPRSTQKGKLKTEDDYTTLTTTVKRGASVGSNSTILCGITIGEGALIGAGSVVTKNVPPFTIVAGNPAKVLRKVDPDQA